MNSHGVTEKSKIASNLFIALTAIIAALVAGADLLKIFSEYSVQTTLLHSYTDGFINLRKEEDLFPLWMPYMGYAEPSKTKWHSQALAIQ